MRFVVNLGRVSFEGNGVVGSMVFTITKSSGFVWSMLFRATIIHLYCEVLTASTPWEYESTPKRV